MAATTAIPVALVTGATSGIGQAAARELRAAGFEVIGTRRDIDRYGRIDVLVNNAGVGSAGAAEESSIAQAQRVFDVNVFGVMRMTKAVLPHMRAQGGGRVVNLSSVLG